MADKITLTDTYIRHLKPPESKRIEITDDTRPGLAIRATTSGHKSFVYRYRYRGKIKRYTIGSFPQIGLAAARRESERLYLLLKQGIDPMNERDQARRKRYTFGELAADYSKRHLPNLRPRTRDEYQRIIDLELLPHFKDIPAAELDRASIIRMLDGIAIDRKKPIQANRTRATLSSIYSFGVDRAVVDFNPILHVKKIAEEKTRDRLYTPEEIRGLWAAFDSQDEPIRSLLKILLICGQRSTETAAMQWENIQGGIWTIPADMTKAGRQHQVPLPALALDVLNELWPLTGGRQYVFASERRRGQHLKWLTSAKNRIRKMENAPADFRIHDLRRTAASYMAGLGINRTVLGKVLNHKGIAGDHAVTAIYDRHKYHAEKAQALARWADHLQHIIAGTEKDQKIFKIG